MIQLVLIKYLVLLYSIVSPALYSRLRGGIFPEGNKDLNKTQYSSLGASAPSVVPGWRYGSYFFIKTSKDQKFYPVFDPAESI